MCGITGWVSFDRDLTEERGIVEAMTATMARRGPDDGGVWIEGHAALGHRRLAVIDIAGGAQPMTVETPNGPVTLVYSGETYNFTELRAELAARGHRFRSRSDTEVVLRGYLEWGDAVAERLVGMSAFAIWDARDERLVLIRDRLGIKPLYLWRTPDGVLFGSEPKAILANPLARPRLGLDGLRELFTMLADCRTAVWDGMGQVDPGTVVTVTRSGVRRRRYWELSTAEHTEDLPATIATVRELLEDSIAGQLVADVPLCTLLSGGLDSSAITALAAARLAADGESVRSFTVDFVDQAENFVADDWRQTPDSPFAQEVARHVGARMSTLTIDVATLASPQVRAAVVAARDLPFGFGDSDASLYLLSRAVREQSTVALSGESADEIFAGYRWFHEPSMRDADTFPWQAAMPKELTRRTGQLRPELVRELDLETYVQDKYREAIAPVEPVPGDSELDTRMRQLSYLHLTRFLRAMLDRKDRLSMATGLEVRVPYCDHRLIEYVYNVPWSMRAFDGREKSLLRAATTDLLPKSVVERVKVHYPLAQDRAYVIALQEQSAQISADRPTHRVFDIIDPDVIAKLSTRPAEAIDLPDRIGLEQFLDLVIWLDHYEPELPRA
ncbi:asparagine synthase (glutamine-hydrolyzing) [Nocardia transvalensis]|uniref:asparagine synthase (glutamine-hydrolyzing) n=1 Tax=Nocardia transvalensis TaxID=37333 RepID=UPI0018958EBD|nr:asparagine synthase (glutamine-hydrolyzing) [Nocardia transvalensis]MBF6330126.1 asparagine synthase (glutamine-hydrolyzing) [Nocardia transvalensis]